jgi:dihydroorotate dehydrogenase electron transfer subunit
MMKIEQARVINHTKLCGNYRLLVLQSPLIASRAKPGQFVHARVPGLENAVLRRPFSIYGAKGKSLSILYKQIGRGTTAMAAIKKDDKLSLIGPLGNGFPLNRKSSFPVLVAGGYGVAPLLFLAKRMQTKGIVFVGGAKAADVLCTSEFKRIGWKVRIATMDGSLGERGLITDVLDAWLAGAVARADVGAGLSRDRSRRKAASTKIRPEFYVCGPDGLLKAVGQRAIKNGWTAWLSLDKHMGCGVGACLACVQRIRLDDGREVWARICKEGPVFEARQVVW